MSRPHAAFAITDRATTESFTYVPGDGRSLAALYPDANDEATATVELVTDTLDTGDLPDIDTLEFLGLTIIPEAPAADWDGVA